MTWAATAQFYDNLRRLLHAGFTMGEALERTADGSRGPYKEWAQQWALGCKAGKTLGEQLPERYALAKALISAGEQSGRLPELCKTISNYYQQCSDTKRVVIAKSIYPVFLIHFATIVPVAAFSYAGFFPSWAAAVGPTLFWLLVISIFVFIKVTKNTDLLHRLLLMWPFSILLQPLVTYLLCLVLEACVSAGMQYPGALRESAQVMPNRILKACLLDGADLVERQQLDSCSAALARLPLNKNVLDLCANGERSGAFEDALSRCARMEKERFDMALNWAAKLLNATIYGAAMAVAVYVIFTAASSYVGQINKYL